MINSKKSALKLMLTLVILVALLPKSVRAFGINDIKAHVWPIYQKITGKYDDGDTSTQPHPEHNAGGNANHRINIDTNNNSADTKNSTPSPQQYIRAPWSNTTSSDYTSKNIWQNERTRQMLALQNPSLAAIIQAEMQQKNAPLYALDVYKTESFKQNATAVFERALSLSLQHESAQQSFLFANTWQKQNTEHIPAWFYVTHLALKSGDYLAATEHLARIIDYDPTADLSRIFMGILPDDKKDKRRLFDALMVLKVDQHKLNKNASLSALKAALLLQMHETQAALIFMNDALKQNPNHTSLGLMKADLLKSLNRFDELYQFLDEAVQNSNGSAKHQFFLYHVRTLIDLGDLQGAWKKLESFVNEDTDSDTLLLAALVALDIKEYENAQILLEKLATNTRYFGQAQYYLGLSFQRQHKILEALFHFQQVDDVQFKLEAVKKQLQYTKDIKKAIQILQDLRKNYEIFASESYLLQANILVDDGQTQAAIDLLYDAFKQYPDDDNLLFYATKLLDDTHDYAQKLSNMQMLITQASNPLYILEHARLVLLRDDNNEEALQNIRLFRQDIDINVRMNAELILADMALKRQDYEAVIDNLLPLYQQSPNLEAGSKLLTAYHRTNNEAMVEAMLLDLTVRFSQVDNFDEALQDY